MPSAAPPPSSAVESDSSYVGGFGDDYELEVPGTFGWGGLMAGPRGATTTTLGELREIGSGGYIGSDVWSIPSGWDGPRMAQLQILLVEAGLLDPGDLEGTDSPGHYGETTRTAFRNLLAHANAAGSSWGSALDKLRANPIPMAGQASGSKPPPFIAEVSNPDDVRAAIRAGFKEALGSGAVDEATLERMVKAWQGDEVSTQRAKYDAAYGNGGEGTGGTITAMPDPSVWVDEQAKRKDPVAYDAYKALDAFSTILNTMGGSGAVGS